jgi:2-dehydro-3-deoxyphosphogluconate aldolase / (4S)-4-hydroxy-2-oxoglutarate aldolase
MDRTLHIVQQIKQQGLLPLFYHGDKEVCLQVVRSLYAAGIRVIEFTNRGESALVNFKALVATRNESMKDLLLGVGTIRTAEQATRFIDAGTDFLVSPVFDTDVCDAAYINKICWLPGCMTPTEVHVAEKSGCRLIKLFPGNVLEPGFVSAIKELFPQIDFMPTGGVEVSKESIGEWFKAGVCAVGLGSKLITKTALENKDYDSIISLTKQALTIVQSIKK